MSRFTSPFFGQLSFLHFSQHLLGQTEDLLPSAATLLMVFPGKWVGKKQSYISTSADCILCRNSHKVL